MIKFEGEEILHTNDSTKMDPDVALSYIGDKIRSLLGHHQKDFEGVISEEKLGARFGFYGSFLPVSQRPPSVMSQSKYSGIKEPPRFITFPHVTVMKDDSVPDPSSALGVSSSQTLRTSFANASNKMADAFPKQAELSSSKSSNFSGSNNLKLRIKMSDATVRKNSAELPVAHDERDGLPRESPKMYDDSPTRILQIMTSFNVPGGLLLSPLSEDLENLFRGADHPEKDGISAEFAFDHTKNDSIVNKLKTVAAGVISQSLENHPPFDHGLLNKSPWSGNPAGAPQIFSVPSKTGSRGSKTTVNGSASLLAKSDAMLKSRLNTKSTKLKGSEIPPSVKGTSLNGMKRIEDTRNCNESLPNAVCLRNVNCDVLESKCVAEIWHSHLSHDSVHEGLGSHIEISSHLVESPHKKQRIDTVCTGKQKLENAACRQYTDRHLSETCGVALPVITTSSNGLFFSSLEHKDVASEVVKEDWVCCDICEKWRLLRHDKNSNQFPGRWVCSMLDWLPGMNRCSISEDETTAAVRALHPAPVPETQQSLLGDLVAGITSASVHHFDQSCTFDQMKDSNLDPRKKIKLSYNKVRGNFCSTEVITTNKSMARELETKRKSDASHGDDENPGKKARKNHLATSVLNDTNVVAHNFSSSAKNQENRVQDLPSASSLDVKENKIDQVAMKIKLKRFEDKVNDRNERKVIPVMHKKSRVCQSEEMFKEKHGDERKITAMKKEKVTPNRRANKRIIDEDTVQMPKSAKFCSSKISGSHKNRIDHDEAKISHHDPVSYESSRFMVSRKRPSVPRNDVRVRELNRESLNIGLRHSGRQAPGSLGSLKSCITNSGDRLADSEACLDKGNAVDVSISLKECEDVLREAEQLKVHGEKIKNFCFHSESNYINFQAGLEFLRGSSLLETCTTNSVEYPTMNLVQSYDTAAKLCKLCAYEYEKCNEMAAAALAFKCMEVAYLRLLYCRSSTIPSLCYDLQSNLHTLPQGESPSSSASNKDNLSSISSGENTCLSKKISSNAALDRSNIARLLDFTRDTNSAMEAAKKGQEAFAAAYTQLMETKNEAAVVSVKRVIDISFQNTKELDHLVRVALNDIDNEGIGRSKQ